MLVPADGHAPAAFWPDDRAGGGIEIQVAVAAQGVSGRTGTAKNTAAIGSRSTIGAIGAIGAD